MEKEIITRVKLISAEGMTLTNGETFGKEIYLGCNDTADNWWGISDEEAQRLMREQEEEKKEE